MRIINILFLLFISVNVFGQGVIPKPVHVELQKKHLDLDKIKIAVGIANHKLKFSHFLVEYLKKEVMREQWNNDRNKKLIYVNLQVEKEGLINETYELEIKKSGIEISGSEVGVFYGLQTLNQLIADSNGKLQCQTIIDSPKFKWRGMHLDVSRHFFDVEFIKKYIDVLALHKMNTFHWHLTDDQGWRIEIKKYPKLTEIGGQRKETIIEKNFDPYKGDGKPYGGFYTQEQIKEVVAYAAERYITVVPEIEMPGHAVAALSAYPQFSCRQQPLETYTKWGVSDDIYCSKDSTFQFIFDVLDEVLELFPSQYIHIGGDEAPKTRWKECAHCQANIKKHNLKDEHELQSYFIGRIDSFLTSKGRKTIGWDEILEGGLAKNAAVMSWRGEKGGIEAASQKHNVVMSPGSHCYFDHYQGDKKTEPLAIGGYTPLKKVYSYNPIPKNLDKKYRRYVLGAQGNVWTEYMETPEHVMYMALPRICALSEVLWSGPGKSSYEDFTDRLIPHFALLDSLGYNYSKSLYNIEAHPFVKEETMFVRLFSDFPEYEIRYTTDGSEPTAKSQLYEALILISRNTNLKARLFKNRMAKGNLFSQQYMHHLAIGKSIRLKQPPNESYNNGGAQTLINGVVGSLPWSGNEWLGTHNGEPMIAVIDFGKEVDISSVKISYLEATESWIHYPRRVYFYPAKSANDFYGDGSKPGGGVMTLDNMEGDYWVKKNLNFKTRYLLVKALPTEFIPDGFPGARNIPWLFCSEIIVE